MELITDEWPIITLKTLEKKINNEMYESFKTYLLDSIKLCSEKNQQCVLVINISSLGFDPSTFIYATRMNKFRNKIFNVTQKYVQNLFIVVKNRNIRNIFKFFTLNELKNNYYFIVKSHQDVLKKLNEFDYQCDNEEILNDEMETNNDLLKQSINQYVC